MFKLMAVTLGVLLLCVPAFSQGNAGRIMGTVTDQSGGVVAGATVSVVDIARGVTRTLTTDDAGEYNAPNLTPGTIHGSRRSQGLQETGTPERGALKSARKFESTSPFSPANRNRP